MNARIILTIVLISFVYKAYNQCFTFPFDRSLDIQNIPETNFPNYTVRLNFIFLQRQDGCCGFQQNNTEHQQLIDEIITELNNTYANLVNTNDPNCYKGTDFVPDTKIRFLVNSLYIQDNFGWNNNHGTLCPDDPNWYLNYLDNQIVNDPSIPRGINIYFTEDSAVYWNLIVNQTTDINSATGIACSQFTSTSDFTRTSKIHYPNSFIKYWHLKNIFCQKNNASWEDSVRYWYYIRVAGRGIAHEIGHSFELEHDALPHYLANQCPYSLMHQGGTNVRNYLPPSEIGRIHTALIYSNVRTFVTEDTYNPYSLLINSNETWMYNKRIYRNYVINSGNTLCLNCNLILPNQGTNYVLSNAILIINSGIHLKGNAKITVQSGGIITAANGANIKLEDANSKIEINSGAYSYLCNAIFTGNGSVNNIPVSRVLTSNLSGTQTIRAWNKIECNNVNITSGSNITLYPKDELIINGTFETGSSSVLTIIPTCPL